MNQIPRRIHLTLVICATFMFVLVFIIQTPVKALENGTGDLDTSCTNCHSNGGLGIINVVALPGTIEANQTNIDFTATVNIDSADTDGTIVGVMLLTESDENIKSAGWEIISSPNNNTYPFNYNEKIVLGGDIEFTWTLRAPPTADNYTIKARLMYEDAGASFLESHSQTIYVAAPQLSENTGLDQAEGGGDYTIDMEALGFGALVGMSSVMVVMILRRRYYE